MTDYVQCPGSQQPMEPERGRTRLEGKCPRCGCYVVVYTPTPGVSDWHATIHEATQAELRRHRPKGPSLMTTEASRVYLLHFERPLAHARHYVGVALDGDVRRRLQEHLAGHGSPLVRAVVAAGIAVDLVLDVPGDRGLERRWHNTHGHGAALCPVCRSQRPPRPRQYRLPFTRLPAPRRGGRSLPWRAH